MAKTAKRSLKSNFVYNFISQILTLIVPLVTTPYLSRVLHETGNGQYSFSASIISYFVLVANLGFDLYGQRQIAAHQDDREEKSKIFWELFALKTALTALSLGLLYSLVFAMGFGGEIYNKLILILSIQVAAVPFDIQFLFRGEENFKTVAVRTIIMKLIGLVCVFLFVRDENDTWVYALCYAASVMVSNLVMWPAVIRKIRFVRVKELRLLRHLKPAVLIFLPTLAVTVYSVFDKTMIGLLAPDADYANGCYEQAYKINSVALLPVTIISSVLVSRNAHDHSVGDGASLERHLIFAMRYVWMMGLPLIAGFAVLSDNLRSWFLGPGYAEVPRLMQIMSVRFIFSGMGEVFGNQLFIAVGKEKYPLIATCCGAAVNIVLNCFLIPLYGAVGAALSTAVCEMIVTIVLTIIAFARGYVKVKWLFGGMWKYVIAVAVMTAPMYFMQRYMGNSVGSFAAIALTGIAVYALCLFILRDSLFLRGAEAGVKSVLGKLKGRHAPPDETGGEISLPPAGEKKSDGGDAASKE